MRRPSFNALFQCAAYSQLNEIFNMESRWQVKWSKPPTETKLFNNFRKFSGSNIQTLINKLMDINILAERGKV